MAKALITNLTPEQDELASKLTTLQYKCVINLVGSNMSQRQAYLAAGGKGKTEESQDNTASVIFRKVEVREFYDSLMASAQSEAVMTKEQALSRLTKSAQVTITDVCDFKNVQVGEDGEGDPVFQTVWTVKNAEDIPPHIAACIKSVTVTKSGPKIELHDSHGAIKQLGDMLGWDSPKKSELTGKDGSALSIKSDVSAPEIAEALAGLMDKV